MNVARKEISNRELLLLFVVFPALNVLFPVWWAGQFLIDAWHNWKAR